MTEYCAVIGMHSMVRGDKLLSGHVPDPFPWCGIGSGHVRLCLALLRTHTQGNNYNTCHVLALLV